VQEIPTIFLFEGLGFEPLNESAMLFPARASFYLALFIFASSCKKEHVEKKDVDCGCESSTYVTIEGQQARHLGNGYFVINKNQANGNLNYGQACDTDSTWTVSKDQDSWNYVISGNLKARCPGPTKEYILQAPGGFIQITTIRKNN
jgi:hypothetical protein